MSAVKCHRSSSISPAADQPKFPVFFARNGERNRLCFKIGAIGTAFTKEVGRTQTNAANAKRYMLSLIIRLFPFDYSSLVN